MLMKWATARPEVAGILVPVIDGKRHLYDLSKKSYDLFESDAGDEEFEEVGRFRFRKNIFEKAQNVLMEAVIENPRWLIVDEVGKLELHRNSGLKPVISNIISRYKVGMNNSTLILCIRDYLLAEAIARYELQDALVVKNDFFEVAGLVLCGGKSMRMGNDKALISYHGKPQFLHAYEMLGELMNEVFISCRPDQSLLFGKLPLIVDSDEFKDAGPMTGLLSAFRRYPGKSFFVLGCDYPFFRYEDCVQLMQARDHGHGAVYMKHPVSGFAEPLLAVYESGCSGMLLSYFKDGNTSLSRFLKTIRTGQVHPASPESLKSIDTKEDSEGNRKL